jgi:hypothetical protein
MVDDEKIPNHIHDQVKLRVGKKQAMKLADLGSPAPQRIMIFGIVLALLMPDERQPFSIVSVANLMANLFKWNPVRTLKEINNFLELCGQKSGPKFDCYGDESGLIYVNLPNELDYSWEILDLKPLPTPRAIIAFAVAMALLVPDENRRRNVALQSIALLMHELFGWSQERAMEEINICVETWTEDGVEPNFWTDDTGHVNVGLSKKSSC